MIMLTGQKGIMSSRQAKFQIVDVVSAFKPLTKLSLQIVSTSRLPTIVHDAFRIAMEERPGPVLLELPEDIAGEKAEDIAMIAPASDRSSGRAHYLRSITPPTSSSRPRGQLIMFGATASPPRSTAGVSICSSAFTRRSILHDTRSGREPYQGIASVSISKRLR